MAIVAIVAKVVVVMVECDGDGIQKCWLKSSFGRQHSASACDHQAEEPEEMVMCNMLQEYCIKNELSEDDGPIPELVDEESDDEETPPRAHSSLLFSLRNVMRLETGISDDSGIRGRFTTPNYSGLELAIPGQVGHSYERYDAAMQLLHIVMRLETGIKHVILSDDSGLRGRFTAPHYSGLELAIPGLVGHS